MMSIEIHGIKVEMSKNCIKIVDSFRTTDDEEKIKTLKAILEFCPEFKEYRTVQNMFWEWKAHNILFRHNYKVSRTRDVDFELKQKLRYKIGYWIIAHLFKESV